MCRILYLDGMQWAMDTTRDLMATTEKTGGIDELIEICQRGTQDKPVDFARGVQEWIDKLKDLRDVQKLRQRKGRKS